MAREYPRSQGEERSSPRTSGLRSVNDAEVKAGKGDWLHSPVRKDCGGSRATVRLWPRGPGHRVLRDAAPCDT